MTRAATEIFSKTQDHLSKKPKIDIKTYDCKNLVNFFKSMLYLGVNAIDIIIKHIYKALRSQIFQRTCK